VAVSFSETVLLGALAGFTIYLSLPLGRLDLLSARARVALAMFAVGVLAFLFVDGFEHAFEIVEEPVEGFRDGKQGIGEAIGLTALLGVGFAAGTAGLGMVERWLRPKGTELPPIAGGSGVLTAEDPTRLEHEALAARARALRTGMTIAAAIGLHNFAEAWRSACRQAAARSAWRPC
jgi:zinc transporter, ZIP family